MGLLIDLALVSLLALPLAGALVLLWLVLRLRRMDARIAALESGAARAEPTPRRTAPREAPERVPTDRPAGRDAKAPGAAPEDAREEAPRPSVPEPQPGRAKWAPPEPEPARAEWAPPEPERARAGRTQPAAGAAPPPTAPRRPGVEERIVRVAIWGAAVILALAGIFLVQWTFERGLLGPTMRVSLGVLFGVTLLAFGQLAQRRAGRIAAAAIAAGIAVLYASLLAGTTLYGLIARPVGFGLIGLVTFTAVALSLRHGPIIALVGLVGGFLTPALIGGGDVQPIGLFLYLVLLQAGLMLVIRRRGWWTLAPAAALGGVLWAAYWLTSGYEHRDVFILGPFLLVTAALAAFTRRAQDDLTGRGDLWSRLAPAAGSSSVASAWVGIGGAVVLASAMAWIGRLSAAEWVFFGIIGAACLLLARREPLYTPLAWLAPGLGAALFWFWGLDVSTLSGQELMAESSRLGLTLAAIALLFVAESYLFVWNSERPQMWAAISASTGITYLVIAWLRVETVHSPWWGIIAIALAAAYTVAAIPLVDRRARGASWEQALASLAAAVTLAVSLAVPMELERQWISVAWAIEVALLAWIFTTLRVRALVALASILAAVVAVRLLANPFVLNYPIGEHALLNWLLYGYGIPAAAFVAASKLFTRSGERQLPLALDGGAAAFGFALLTLLVRHYFHANLTAFDLTLRETAAYAIVWLLYSCLLFASTDGRPLSRPIAEVTSRLAAVAGVGVAFLGPGLIVNPLIAAEPVGATPVWNALLLTHGAPALLALVVAYLWKSRNDRAWSLAAGAASLALWFLFLTLEVRQAFQGDFLYAGKTSDGEWYAYSAAWLLFGLLLLALGIVQASSVLRFASLAVMLIVVAKVFLFDMNALTGLFRVFSFLGLGVSLLLLAWIYQRFVFRRPV